MALWHAQRQVYLHTEKKYCCLKINKNKKNALCGLNVEYRSKEKPLGLEGLSVTFKLN
jgi:hypothetical protein